MQTYMTPQQHFRIARNGGLTLFLTLAFIAVSWCQVEGVLIEGELRQRNPAGSSESYRDSDAGR